MSARALKLYVRSRGAPYAIAGVVLLSAIAVAARMWLSDLVQVEHQVAVVFATMLAAVILGGSLGSPSPELDITAAFPWWRWRASHALVGLVLCVLPLAAAIGSSSADGAGIDSATVRNVLGFSGLAMLTAVLAGARLSWTVPLVYSLIVWVLPAGGSPAMRVWRWPLLSDHTALSWWPALALCAASLVLVSTRAETNSLSHDL
jgi:hypothetical protein